jgi:orotate phosphoribosyltransferase
MNWIRKLAQPDSEYTTVTRSPHFGRALFFYINDGTVEEEFLKTSEIKMSIPVPRYKLAALNGFLYRLYERGAVKIDTEEGFRLKLHDSNPDAPRSPLYFNLRVPANKDGPLTEEDVNEIAGFFFSFLCNSSIVFDAICPVPNAGDPFALALQKIYRERIGRSIPILDLSKEVMAGSRRVGELVQSSLSPVGLRVLVLDDLISRSDSKAEAVESLRRAGCKVNDSLVFLDRQQGGRQGLEKMAVDLHSIVNLANVLEFYKDSGVITSDQYTIIQAYLLNAQ